MDCSLPASSVHGILRQEYWSVLPFPSPEDLSDPGIEPRSPMPPALASTYHYCHLGSSALRSKGPCIAKKYVLTLLILH